MTETQVLRQTEIPEPETVAVTAQGASEWLARDPVAEIPYDQLGDFNFLLNQYYIVDASTSIDESLLDAEAFLSKDFSIVKDPTVPQILIYHTHSQEEFADSIPGDDTTTIVGVGDYLTELLEATYGYQVIHDRGVYDLIDGVLDRDAAYAVSYTHLIRKSVEEACQKGLSYGAATEKEVEMARLICEVVPSIEMVRMVNSGTELSLIHI